MDNAMQTLNAARRAIGFSAQGIGCSPVVITKTLRQLERNVGNDAVPKTVTVLKSMLDNKGLASEKAAKPAMDEINELRSRIKQRLAQTDQTADVEDGEPPRPN